MRNRYRSTWYSVYFGCLGIALLCSQHSIADEPDLLSVVREGHRAARQSIKSFSATVTDKINISDRHTMTITAKYWRSLDTVHIREKQGGGTDDMLLKDGEIRQVGRAVAVGPRSQPGKVHYVASRRAAVETLAASDVWGRMMIDFAGPNGGRYDFDHFLEFAQRPPQVSREKIDGHDCVRLNLSVVSTTGLEEHVTLWHDINRNYLVWKMMVREKPSDRGEMEILEFTEPEPGVFVPIKCRRDSYRDSELSSREEITLSDVEINKPIPANVLQLPAIPAGTILNDGIRGTRYPINEKWEPIGPPEPLQQLRLPGEAEAARSDYHSQSTSEAKPLSRLLVPASLLILVVACACLIYRHYRSRDGLRRVN
jgi:hypothetical protein